MPRKTNRNYAGRQLDIELLDHIEKTLPEQVVVPDSHTSPRIVAGIEKVVQRYAKLFLTSLGSVKSSPDTGSTLLQEIGAGAVSDLAYLDHLCSIASVSAMEAMVADDADGSFGELKPDERISDAEIDDLEIDEAAGRIKVKIHITTEAGDTFEFVVPVGSGYGA